MLWPPVRRAARAAAMVWHAIDPAGLFGKLRAWHPPAMMAAGLLSALLTLQTLRFSAVTADWSTALGFLQRPMLFVLNWAPIAALLFALLFALGRPYLAYALTALPVLGLTLVNYYKLLLRGDPLLFADLRLVGEASAMSARYTLPLRLGVVFAVLCTVLLTLWLRRTYRGERVTRAGWRALGCAACAMTIAAYGSWALGNDALYARTGLSVSWMPMQSYVAHGVVYPFLRSAASAGETAPPAYDPEKAAATLGAYPEGNIPDAEKVNIVAVMLEAYCDLSTFDGLTFAADPYQDMHALMAESYSGELVTNIFAGETVNTERAFLTGYIDPSENFRGPVSSFVWYLREQGYRTQGSHPGNNWFYNRLNVNAYLGFESYHFYEDRYRWFIKGARILPDARFMPTIVADYNLAKVGREPLFSFHVTYQNHGPYATTREHDQTYLPWKDGYNPEDYAIANNYFAGLAETGRQIKALAEFFRGETEPTVLIVFGDHKPWWGDGNSTYSMFGLNLDRTTEEGFYHYFDTPYLIWANDAAKAALGNDFVGDGGRIAPSMLMERFFTLAGWQGPKYMQAIRELEKHTLFVNRERWLEDGVLTGADAAEEPQWLKDFRQVEYYEKHRLEGQEKE